MIGKDAVFAHYDMQQDVANLQNKKQKTKKYKNKKIQKQKNTKTKKQKKQ